MSSHPHPIAMCCGLRVRTDGPSNPLKGPFRSPHHVLDDHFVECRFRLQEVLIRHTPREVCQKSKCKKPERRDLQQLPDLNNTPTPHASITPSLVKTQEPTPLGRNDERYATQALNLR